MTLLFGLFVVVGAILRGVYVYRSIVTKQRNAAARYMPEYEARITPETLVQNDQYLGRLKHRGGSEISGRNDETPQKRAKSMRAFLVDAAGAPPPITEPVTTTQGQQPPTGAPPQA